MVRVLRICFGHRSLNRSRREVFILVVVGVCFFEVFFFAFWRVFVSWVRLLIYALVWEEEVLRMSFQLDLL